MKKKSIILKALIFALLPLTLTACVNSNDNNTTTKNTPITTNKGDDNKSSSTSAKPIRLERAIYLDTMGGNSINELVGMPGASVSAPADPVKSLYTFDGWYIDKEYSKKYTFSVIPTEDITIYAKWINPANASKIKFDTLGADLIDEIHGNVGDVINMPANPTRRGYSFGGWYKDIDLSIAFNDTTYKDSDLTLYAKWDLNEGNYSIKYHVADMVYDYLSEDGKIVFDNTLIPANTIIEGWYLDEELTTPAVENTDLTGNVDLYASFYSKGLIFDVNRVVGYDGISSNVYIPSIYNNIKIDTIDSSVFRDNQIIKNVILPKTITRINSYAFYNATYLEEIKLPDTIEEIENYVFYNCYRLKNINTIGKVDALSPYVFAGCNELRNFDNINNVEVFGTACLAGCKNLTALDISSAIKIQKYAFKDLIGISEINIPASAYFIEEAAFQGMNYNTAFTIDENNEQYIIENNSLLTSDKKTLIKYFGNELNYNLDGINNIMGFAFENNNTLEELDISNVDVIGFGILSNVNSLKKLTIKNLDKPISTYFGTNDGRNNGSTNKFISNELNTIIIKENVTEIPAYSFYGINKLNNVVGIDNVEIINEYAFAYTAFEAFELSKDLDTLNPLAFYNCNNLKQFMVNSSNGKYKSINSCIYDIDGKDLLMVPSRIENFVFATSINKISKGAFDGVKINELIIPESIVEIERGALSGVIGLTSLEANKIGDGVDNQYMHYLFGSTKLVETNIDPITNEEVRKISFDNLDDIPQTLKTIIINGNIDKIDEYAFYSFAGLTDISYSNSVTSIGDYAFYNTDLIEINIPSTIIRVGKNAFSNCDKLKKVVIASEEIGDYAFELDTRLEEITFAEGVKEIPSHALYAYSQKVSNLTDELQYVSVLKKINISKTVTKIGDYAFYYAGVNEANATSSVKPVVEMIIEDGSVLEEIGEYAFENSHLKEAFLPSTVKKIGRNAFNNCELLKTICFGDLENKTQIEEFGELAFANTLGLESMYIYKEVTQNSELPLLYSLIQNSKRAYPFDGINENFVLYVLSESLDIYLNNNDYKAAGIKIKAII